MIDNESEAGSWKREMERAPWAFGQHNPPTVPEILALMRLHGLGVEADILANEFVRTKALTSEKT